MGVCVSEISCTQSVLVDQLFEFRSTLRRFGDSSRRTKAKKAYRDTARRRLWVRYMKLVSDFRTELIKESITNANDVVSFISKIQLGLQALHEARLKIVHLFQYTYRSSYEMGAHPPVFVDETDCYSDCSTLREDISSLVAIANKRISIFLSRVDEYFATSQQPTHNSVIILKKLSHDIKRELVRIHILIAPLAIYFSIRM